MCCCCTGRHIYHIAVKLGQAHEEGEDCAPPCSSAHVVWWADSLHALHSSVPSFSAHALHCVLHVTGGSGWFATPRKLWTLPPQLTAIAQVRCSAVAMGVANTPSSLDTLTVIIQASVTALSLMEIYRMSFTANSGQAGSTDHWLPAGTGAVPPAAGPSVRPYGRTPRQARRAGHAAAECRAAAGGAHAAAGRLPAGGGRRHVSARRARRPRAGRR